MSAPVSNSDRTNVLANRLATGWAMCDRERDLSRKSQLERHWIAILREYEELIDEIAAPQQSEMRGVA